MDQTRRTFIKNVTTAAAGLPLLKWMESAEIAGTSTNFPIAFFTKPLDDYELDFMLEVLAGAGLDGLDLSVRPGGRVEPSHIQEQLPFVVEAAKHHGLKTEMMVSAITSANEPLVNEVLKTAAEVGVKHYRLGYFKYEANEMVPELERIRKAMAGLAVVNERVGIQGGYQNHTGKNFGSPMWDLWEVLRQIPSHSVSSQFDIRHAVTEGANSWELAMRLLHERIGSLAIKDFTWGVSGHEAKVVGTPLGEGIVNFDAFFSILKEKNISAPITLHIEYPLLSDSEKGLSLSQQRKILTEKIKKDVDFIRLGLAKFNLT